MSEVVLLIAFSVMVVANVVSMVFHELARRRQEAARADENERLLHAALAKDAREYAQLDKTSKHAAAALRAAAPPPTDEDAKRREYEAYAAGQLASMGYEGFETPPLVPDGI